jgi:DNA-3-methyladenine glycosylase II
LAHLAQRARRVFDLDSDPLAASEHLAGDPVLAPLVRADSGLRLPGTWDAFEVGIRALLGQQITVRAARTLATRLVTQFGEPVPGLEPFGLTHLFPTAEGLAKADVASIGMPASRARAITAYAAAVASDDVDLDGRRSLSELITSLTAVKGIGAWTAHYIALRLGERDAFPAGDLALRKVYASLTGRDSVSTAELEAAAEPWRPWRAYAAVHLWRAYTTT